MDDKLLLATVSGFSAIIGGVLSGIISPIVKHRIDQHTLEISRRREQVSKWRDMIVKLSEDQSYEGGAPVHPDFLSLEPQLSDTARKKLHRPRNEIVIVSGSSLPYDLIILKDEVSRIEKAWGLNSR